MQNRRASGFPVGGGTAGLHVLISLESISRQTDACLGLMLNMWFRIRGGC